MTSEISNILFPTSTDKPPSVNTPHTATYTLSSQIKAVNIVLSVHRRAKCINQSQLARKSGLIPQPIRKLAQKLPIAIFRAPQLNNAQKERTNHRVARLRQSISYSVTRTHPYYTSSSRDDGFAITLIS